jgi:hypothetical protein
VYITIEIPDGLFAFYSAYLKAKDTDCGRYLAQLLREDINAIIESLEPGDLPSMFDLPSTLRVKVQSD